MNKKGFTLIETLVYIGLFGILVSGVMASVYELQKSSTRIAAQAENIDEGIFILEKIRYEVLHSTKILSPSSGETGIKLSLKSPSGISVYEIVGEQLMRTNDFGESYLNGNTSKIETFQISHSTFDVPSAPYLDISFTLSHGIITGSTFSENFSARLYEIPY